MKNNNTNLLPWLVIYHYIRVSKDPELKLLNW